MSALALLLAGALVGIGLNWLADNLPPAETGERPAPHRPHCGACGRHHHWPYWSALVSLTGRAGRCEHCGAPRPPRLVIVEVIAASGAVLLWWWSGGVWSRFVPGAALGGLAILVAVIDIEHQLVLRVVMLPAALLLGCLGALTPGRGLIPTVQGGLAGYASVYAIYLFGQAYAAFQQHRQGLDVDQVVFGGGDVNLAGVLGLAVGWPGIWPALLIGICAGAVVAVAYVLAQLARRRPVASALPYGPCLLLGALLIYFGAGSRP